MTDAQHTRALGAARGRRHRALKKQRVLRQGTRAAAAEALIKSGMGGSAVAPASFARSGGGMPENADEPRFRPRRRFEKYLVFKVFWWVLVQEPARKPRKNRRFGWI